MGECWLVDGELIAVDEGMPGSPLSKAQAWEIMMLDPLVGVEGTVRWHLKAS